MSLVARQMTQQLAAFPFERMVSAARNVLLQRRATPAPELLDAQSLAAVGMAGLLALPALMLASIPFDAPLAGPAAISLGYLAIARSLMADRPHRAAAWSAAVLAGLIAWTLLVFIREGGMLSAASLVAGLLAPAFAAAPALVRWFTRTGRGSRAALMADRQAGLDRRGMASPDVPAKLSGKEPAPSDSACTPAQDIRLERALTARADTEIAGRAAAPASDICEAIGFALRHAGPRAAARHIELICSCPAGIVAACDQQTSRRILHVLIKGAIGQSRPADTVRITGKQLKGTVLLRVASIPELRASCPEARLPDLLSPAALRQTVESVGGTIMFEMSRGVARVSVRLPQVAEPRT